MREWLKDLRGEKSQCSIAKESNISQNFYSDIETGNRSPSVKVAKAIAKVLNFDWTRFYDDEN